MNTVRFAVTLCLLAIYVGGIASDPCFYTSSYGKTFDLSSLQDAGTSNGDFFFANAVGSHWINFCAPANRGCGGGACQFAGSQLINLGNIDNYSWTEYDADTVYLHYYGGTYCGAVSENRQTRIKIYCSASVTQATVTEMHETTTCTYDFTVIVPCSLVTDTCDVVSASQLDTVEGDHSRVDDVSFRGDSLQVIISHGMKVNRTATIIEFYGGAAACNYPTGSEWTYYVADCRHHYVLSMPWSVHASCGFERSESSLSYDFGAVLKVTHREYNGLLLDEVAAYRNLTDTFNVALSFKKTLEISTTVLVNAPVATEAAVVQQRFEPTTLQGEVDLRIVLQYPFVVTAATVAAPAGFTDATATFVEKHSNSDGFDDQTWRVTFSPNGCILTGSYVWTFTVGCVSDSPNGCPIDYETNTTTVIVNLISESVCQSTSTDITFSGELDSYGDGDFSAPQFFFLQNATAYFMAKVSSDEATIVNTAISDVVFMDGAVETPLLTAQTLEADGTAAALVAFAGSDSATFDFKLLHSFVDVPSLYPKPFTVKATVIVEYYGNDKKRTTKRIQLTTSSTGVDVFRAITVGLPEQEKMTTPENSADTPSRPATEQTRGLIYGMTFVGIALVAAVALLAFVVKRRYTTATNYSIVERT